MELLKNLSVMWSLLHTLVIFLFLFEPRYSKKRTTTITLATMIPLILVNMLLFIFLGLENYGTLMLLTLSLPSCVVFWFLSKYRAGRFFFTFCMVDTTVLEIVYLSNILNHYLTPDTNIVMFVIRLFAYPLLEILVYKKLRPIFLSVQEQTKRGWWLFAVIGLLFYIAITLIMTHPTPITNRPDQLPVLIILFILMPIIYLHIISTLRRQQVFHEQTQQENIMRLQVANVTARMEELGEANERFRVERHNFRHKLKAIASLAASNQLEELQSVISEYEEDLQKTRIVRYSNNAIIDAVLSSYIKKAENAGITLKLGFAFPDAFEAGDSELATALANAIENSINACEKLPESQRFLEIKVLCQPKFIIMIRNSFDGNIQFGEDGIPHNPHEEHGFGTRSIAAFCKKYGGYSEFTAEENVFTLFMHLK